MKKLALSMFAFFGFAVVATAQTVTVADVEALPGQTVSAELKLEAPADTYTGVQLALQFPATGFSVESVSGWTGLITKGTMSAGKISISAAGDNTFTDATIVVSFTVDAGLDLDDYDVTVSGQFEGPDDGFGNDIKTPFSNVTFKVTVTDRITLDEASTVAPAAASGVNVKVKRTIKAGEWSTICLPFTMTKAQADAAFGSGYEVKQYKSYTAEIDEITFIPSAITLTFADYTLNALKKINAGVPYLIKTAQDIESFNVDGVDISASTSDVSGAETNNGIPGKFKGTLAKTKVPGNGLFISGNKFYYSTGETNIKAFRGWFELDAVLNVPAAARVYLNFEGEATGVKTIKAEGNESYYDLQGRHVNEPTKKGLYIRGNKKVFIK